MNKLKEVRLSKGLTQKQLAEAANINIRVLQHYEQGSKNFDHARIDTILNVCNTLECRLSDIIQSEDILKTVEQYEKCHS